jgi:glutamyl-tRNA synthetase
LRPRQLPDGWFADWCENGHRRAAALRFRVDPRPVAFEDQLLGPRGEDVAAVVGDFVLQRRDGLYAYQLAVVVDDLAMGVTEVVRGRDLLSSTGRQVQLLSALGGTPPAYAHLPLLFSPNGGKLSKRDGALAVRALRQEGVAAERIVGYLAWSLGLLERPQGCRPAELVSGFRWSTLGMSDRVLPADLAAVLAKVP